MARPNIILITVDGMRWNGLGALGNPDIRTPNLDALASLGLSFTHAAACRVQAQANRATSLSGAFGTSAVSMLGHLRQAGYQTGAVGAVESTGKDFDQLVQTGGDESNDAYLQWCSAELAALQAHPERESPSLDVTTWIGNQAVRFCQSADEPFFLWAGFTTQTDTPSAWRNMYASSALQLPDGAPTAGEDQLRKRLAAHYGAVSHMDRQIGRMLATLTARGRTNNVFIFTATQGAYLGHHGLYENEQGPLYDSIVRVPLIIGGLLGQRKGERDNALVSVSDFPATILDALNISTTERHDNLSFLPQMRFAGQQHRKALTIEGNGAIRAIRSARYKWITDKKSDTEHLFDLQTDPSEQNNLSDTRQALPIRKMLAGLL
jgi:arylsulfatase A-like enzyme